jgi:hypothetical protein
MPKITRERKIRLFKAKYTFTEQELQRFNDIKQAQEVAQSDWDYIQKQEEGMCKNVKKYVNDHLHALWQANEKAMRTSYDPLKVLEKERQQRSKEEVLPNHEDPVLSEEDKKSYAEYQQLLEVQDQLSTKFEDSKRRIVDLMNKLNKLM